MELAACLVRVDDLANNKTKRRFKILILLSQSLPSPFSTQILCRSFNKYCSLHFSHYGIYHWPCHCGNSIQDNSAGFFGEKRNDTAVQTKWNTLHCTALVSSISSTSHTFLKAQTDWLAVSSNATHGRTYVPTRLVLKDWFSISRFSLLLARLLFSSPFLPSHQSTPIWFSSNFPPFPPWLAGWLSGWLVCCLSFVLFCLPRSVMTVTD